MRPLRTLAALLCLLPSLALAGGASLPPVSAGSSITIAGSRSTLGSSLLARPAQSVVQRAPSATDDTTLGYKTGDLWLAPRGRIYQAGQVAAGTASWLPVAAGRMRPLDAVSGAVAAYGNRALKAAWLNGNWIDVATTAGGTATTIKFINGEPDLASLDALLSGGVGYVSKWYDQSGNGNDATQTTAANQPVITATNAVSGLRSIVFNSFQVSGGYTAALAKYLAIPTTASFAQSSTSLFFAGQVRSQAQTGTLAALGSGSQQTFYATNSVYGVPGMAVPSAASANLGVVAPAGPAVLAFDATSNSGLTLYANNETASLTYAPAVATVTGGFLGNNSVGSYGPGEQDAVATILYSGGLTTAQATKVRAALALLFDIAPQVGADTIWVADGDSITNGYGATYMQGYPRQALDTLTAAVRMYNVAISGTTVANKLPVLSAYYGPIYKSWARTFVVTLHIGTNDIVSANATGATVYANVQSYVAQLKALGGNVRVIVSTILPRNNLTTSQATELANFNTAIRAGWSSFADGFYDAAADPVMGASGAPSNASLYVDGLHPTDLGYSYLATGWAKTVSGWLQ